MTIESAYSDFVAKSENPELGRTCLTRAVDAALPTRTVSGELIDQLRGQEVSLNDSYELILDEVFGGNRSTTADGLGAVESPALRTRDQESFKLLAEMAFRGDMVLVVWTAENHVESLLPAESHKFPEDKMRIDTERQWLLSDHYFYKRLNNPSNGYRAFTIQQTWDRMFDFDGDGKQLLIFPPEPK
jgi:hypothetical protein